ncbi:dihydrodipicolinate synthase family protein, partial [Bacillus cereus group sp. BC64]
MNTRFEGIWLPIITPFHHGEVDHAALARLARHYAATGLAGFVAGATTGEGVLLDAREQDAVFATLRD